MANNTESKFKNFLRKWYHFRVKVDRQGEPVVNVSSIFAAACLLFAPHMTAIGVIAALLMGYQFRFENEEMDDSALEEKIRAAAENVKNGAMNAVKSLRTEIDKARGQNDPAGAAKTVGKTVGKTAEAAPTAGPTNEELLHDLESRAEEIAGNPNPAATTFHSAYAASAGSVPVLRVEEDPAETPEAGASSARSSAE